MSRRHEAGLTISVLHIVPGKYPRQLLDASDLYLPKSPKVVFSEACIAPVQHLCSPVAALGLVGYWRDFLLLPVGGRAPSVALPGLRTGAMRYSPNGGEESWCPLGP